MRPVETMISAAARRPLAIGPGHESLRDRGRMVEAASRGPVADVGGKKSMIRFDRLGGIQRVECGKDQVAGLRRRKRGADGLLVAHLPIRITSGSWRITRRKSRAKLSVSTPTLALVDDRLLVAMQVLDRVLEGDDVAGRVELMWSIIAARVVDCPSRSSR